jgi:hypothetical protein
MMDFFAPINIRKLPDPISYRQKILLVGSCFTEHIGNSLSELKFRVLQNPNGILFDPVSVCRSLVSYIEPAVYNEKDLFYLNETWSSWAHHSRFSATDSRAALEKINNSQREAHDFLNKADWLIITLGSSFSYRLTELSKNDVGKAVANCHRAPAQWFDKHLLDVEETVGALKDCTMKLREFNPGLKILYTVSPVRHLRDGVVANNRSKARLIEAVHQMVDRYELQYYFPAYELVIDVLRDYRFYDIDLAHPNYAATKFVLEKFAESCIDEPSRSLMEEVRSLVTSRKHRAFQPETNAHREFITSQLRKAVQLKEDNPFLDLDEEIRYFSRA